MTRVGTGHTAPELSGKFAHTLIPIAFAYALAHYFSLLMYQGQALGYLISDPLGHGSNLFGTADAGIDYNVVTATTIWYVQVGALVLGPRRGPDARARSRARDLREPARSGALAVLDADRDDRLHEPRPVAPVGADVVIWFPLAHAGHWLPDLLIYGGPVVIGILAVRYADRKERKKDEDARRVRRA